MRGRAPHSKESTAAGVAKGRPSAQRAVQLIDYFPSSLCSEYIVPFPDKGQSRKLLRLDAGRLDDRPPFFDLGPLKGAERLR
jgi:hypothetical protein